MSANPHLELTCVSAGSPTTEADGAVVLLHGRGRDTDDILQLAAQWRLPGLHYRAPPAAGASWYPNGFMAPLADNQPMLDHAIVTVDAVVDALLAAGFRSERIAIAGFSQGACLACEYALQRPRRYGAIIAFTGGAIGPDGTDWPASDALQGTPVFLGSSDIDEWVPEARVHETAALFHVRGAEVDTRIYPGMAHLVCDDEIAAGRALLETMMAADTTA